MRKALQTYLESRLLAELGTFFPRIKSVDEAHYFNGNFAFKLDSVGCLTFFLAVIADEKNDTFRINFAWSPTGEYPLSPAGDIRWGIEQYLSQSAGEFQLALLSPPSIPWRWGLDVQYLKWQEELSTQQAAFRENDAISAAQFANLLSRTPSKCSTADAKKAADRIAAEVAGCVERYARPFMVRVSTNSDANQLNGPENLGGSLV